MTESAGSPSGSRTTSWTAPDSRVRLLRGESRGYLPDMPTLPRPRGPIGEHLVDALAGEPRDLDPIPVESQAPLVDEDLQLSLYVCYELAYRSFDEVDPRWEWNPSLLW